MVPRLRILRNLLSEDGSVWISIDDDEGHYLKVLCDEVFGRDNFINTVIWEKKFSPQNDAKWLSDSHDFVLVYAKNKATWRPNLLTRTEDMDSRYINPYNDPRGAWASSDLTVRTYNESCDYPITTPSGRVVTPSKSRCWGVSKERFAELVADNRIWFGIKGNNVPRIKTFLSEVQGGLVAMTLWKHTEVGNNQDAKKEVKKFNLESPFATPKPERLIERILTLGSNLGDIVLDSFLGSGTTTAVAHKMGRRYIGIELGEHCYTHCLPRLKAVVDGEQGGISRSVNWQGGGGFKFYELAPTLIVKDKHGNLSSNKYVFSGLDKFVEPPRIIDGGNYEEFRQRSLFETGVTINIFNISKMNSETGRMRRLNEVLGQSYFEYLQSLTDLCIFMDESHHYHADRGFETINELHPILGVELTATPQIQSGARKIDFKNVVYEYSLAHALNDGLYVKVPVVFTRKDFRPEEYSPEQLDHEKLNDGIRIHEETKSKLDVYARTFGKPLVKPFVLVVAKDTEHSRQIREYLTSTDFFHGYYKDKVLEINSSQRGAEKDENIELLLSLENPDNRIEIVIHVNMLKEGWDVTNLYTIIPLRASASETLTEQTIGRGLRLPYGQRTGEDEVDRLSLVSHDRYEAIVRLANDPDSLVRRVYYIDPAEPQSNEQRETLEMPTVYDELTTAESFTEQLVLTLKETASEYFASKPPEQTAQVAQFVAHLASRTIMELGKQVKTFDATKDAETKKLVHTSIITETIRQFPTLELKKEDLTAVVEKAIETCTQALTENIIPIPQAVVQPFTEIKHGFYDFKLDTRNMKWHPSDDTLIGTELQEGGETFEYDTEFALFPKIDTVENEIVRHIIVHDNVDYSTSSELIYSLIADAKKHFLSYLNVEETEKVMRDRQRSLAQIIYAQMNEHFYKEETNYRASSMRPFTRIETGFGGKFKSDDLYDLRASLSPSEVKTKIFKGFKKACHTLYKFDSNTERIFAIVLENDAAVLKWIRPSAKQFNIYYGPGGVSRYEPDFIVETADTIYMAETKASDEVRNATQNKSGDVWEKAISGQEYCRAVTVWNAENGGKPWAYALISHDEVRLQSSFTYLVKNRVAPEQLKIE